MTRWYDDILARDAMNEGMGDDYTDITREQACPKFEMSDREEERFLWALGSDAAMWKRWPAHRQELAKVIIEGREGDVARWVEAVGRNPGLDYLKANLKDAQEKLAVLRIALIERGYVAE